ncbi:MAG: NAD(+) diphosphatase [Pseudomonadota bacterium]
MAAIPDNHNVFAGAFVDRFGERRKDPEWVARALDDPKSRYLPVFGELCLLGGDPPAARLLGREQVAPFIDSPDEIVFLGLFNQRPTFALGLSADETPAFADEGEFMDLRRAGTILPADEANLVAHARALVLWHQSQLYCGRCGSATRPDAGANMRRCTNPDCGASQFPRVDPAIIVLVSDGERCLLGRQASWPEARYSTIAGFVEPGESLEDAVRREVYEETNIRVGDVRYASSQPWPFPSSLMLGFYADALSTDIVRNDGELEDARWFTRAELGGDFPKLPFGISIARRLVDGWIDGTDG